MPEISAARRDRARPRSRRSTWSSSRVIDDVALVYERSRRVAEALQYVGVGVRTVAPRQERHRALRGVPRCRCSTPRASTSNCASCAAGRVHRDDVGHVSWSPTSCRSSSIVATCRAINTTESRRRRRRVRAQRLERSATPPSTGMMSMLYDVAFQLDRRALPGRRRRTPSSSNFVLVAGGQVDCSCRRTPSTSWRCRSTSVVAVAMAAMYEGCTSIIMRGLDPRRYG